MIAEIKRLLQSRDRVLVAIDGGSGSGKTTMATQVAAVLRGNLFHMDDFFLPANLRTKQRLAQAGGNIHWERFLSEVLEPVLAAKPAIYRPFDCAAMQLGAVKEIQPNRLNIIEGVYCLHPALCHAYDLKVFIDISWQEQQRRVKARESEEMQRRYFEEWIPMENRYFDELKIKESCSIIIPIG